MYKVDAKDFKFLCFFAIDIEIMKPLVAAMRTWIDLWFCLFFSFDRGCISLFQDCPLCGLDIHSIESDPEMQGLVDRFIEGLSGTKRPPLETSLQEGSSGNVEYEGISVERGSFLVQQAMRVSISYSLVKNICIDS